MTEMKNKMNEQQMMMYSLFHSLIDSLLAEQIIDEYLYNAVHNESGLGEIEAMLMKEKLMPFVAFLKEQAYTNAEYEIYKYDDNASHPNDLKNNYDKLLNDPKYANIVQKVN